MSDIGEGFAEGNDYTGIEQGNQLSIDSSRDLHLEGALKSQRFFVRVQSGPLAVK